MVLHAFRPACLTVTAALLLSLAASACSNSTTAATPVVVSLSSVTLSSNSVVGGASVSGTLNLTAVAPVGGAVVTLTSSSTSVTVPASVTIPAGSTSQSFAIATTAVAATATITATSASASQVASLVVTIVAVPALQALSLSTNVASGGLPVTGTLALTAPAPAGGLSVSLASGSALATVPAVVTFPQGTTTLTFLVTTFASAVPTPVLITASYLGVMQTAALTIGQVAISVLTASVPGGLTVTGTVTLPAPAPDAGAAVTLASSTPNAVVPANVIIPGGATSQSFTIATINAPPTTTATITASYGGASHTTTLVVVAYPNVVALTCTPASATGGTPVSCSGTLAGPSPAAGWRLNVAASDPSVVVPAGVTVGPSSQTFQFSLGTTTVTAATTVSVQLFDAQSGLALWSQILTVTP
jgi:hypothetical protein